MNNLTPEQYKKLAKFAGIPYHDEIARRAYTPDTNDAQAFELLRKLLHAGDWEVSAQDETQFLAWSESRYIDESEGLSNEPSHFISESLNLAICHAVLALEGEG